MKACVLKSPKPVDARPIALTDVAVPSPADDELLVRVTACGVCRTDLHVIEGELPVRRSPLIPGHQIVGTVEKIGTRVEEIKVGQRVGIAWLHHTCGECRFCKSERENLCERAEFTGWTVDGGYAEYAIDEPPVKLDAAIIFAPAGKLVPVALAALDKGGVLVLGGIHMSPIPSFEYSLIYGERVVRSVANNTRDDGREFLAEAARIR